LNYTRRDQGYALSELFMVFEDFEKIQMTYGNNQQGRRQWFSVGIFPFKLRFGLTSGSCRTQSAPDFSFLLPMLPSVVTTRAEKH
jgi:hypothetical protein